MRNDDIYSPEWEVARTYLRSRFRNGNIAYADRKDLERALVILAHAGDKDPWTDETESFRAAIGQLLQARIAWQMWFLTLVCAACAIIQAFGVFWVIYHQK